MAKKITAYVKLQVKGGVANPSPPVGPALGQHGVNIMEFCKQFNAQTQTPALQGKPLPVIIAVYSDRSFTFEIKTPPASYLILETTGIKKGSSVNKDKVGKITVAQLEKIAAMKMPDLNAASMKAAIRTIAGSARSMGIVVDGEL